MKWLVTALLLLFVGLALGLGPIVYALYALLGVWWLGHLFTQRWIGAVTVDRFVSQAEATIGDSVEVVVTIRNAGRLRVPWLLVEDSLAAEALSETPPRLEAQGVRIQIGSLAGHGETVLEYRLTCRQRGYHQIGPVLVETGDLFGLNRRFRVAGEPVFLIVPPKVVPLEGYDLASRQPIGEIRIQHRLFEDPTRLAGVRPYAPGDSLNRIHWRATARTGELQTRVFEASTVAGVTVVLDFHEAGLQGEGRVFRRELAVTTVASLAHTVQQLNQPIGFLSNARDAADRIREEGWNRNFSTRRMARTRAAVADENERLQPVWMPTRRAPDQFSQLLPLLARLETTDGMTFDTLLIEAGARIPRNTTVLAVLPRVTEAAAVRLASLHRRGWSVTVVQVSFRAEGHEWAALSDWEAWLVAAGVPVRRVGNEDDLRRLCGERLIRA
jgi:uncharacterized protein (DUF58 family)